MFQYDIYNLIEVIYRCFIKILLDNNILDVLQHNLNEPNKFLRKEVSWILANIVSGGSTIVQRVMDHEIFNLMRQKSISDEIIVFI